MFCQRCGFQKAIPPLFHQQRSDIPLSRRFNPLAATVHTNIRSHPSTKNWKFFLRLFLTLRRFYRRLSRRLTTISNLERQRRQNETALRSLSFLWFQCQAHPLCMPYYTDGGYGGQSHCQTKIPLFLAKLRFSTIPIIIQSPRSPPKPHQVFKVH